MLLCAVKARQIRSCLNETLIALHSNITNNHECWTWSLFSSFPFIIKEIKRIWDNSLYSWSLLLLFATEQSLFVLQSEDLISKQRLMTCNRTIKTCGWVFKDKIQDLCILELMGLCAPAAGRKLGRDRSDQIRYVKPFSYRIQHTAHN